MVQRWMKIVAGLVVLDVIVIYIYCIIAGRIYPPSHPWSGIALILLSCSLFLQARSLDRFNNLKRSAPVIVAVLIAISCAFWTIAALL